MTAPVTRTQEYSGSWARSCKNPVPLKYMNRPASTPLMRAWVVLSTRSETVEQISTSSEPQSTMKSCHMSVFPLL
ncbi:hypothetical protein Sfulv_60490 [Streptomyces fulvorobeus]|uniref:Uncharacterized protein n=1 Tax=Streptomyces fulvorobeus TaxID=284028 RepID=A0A7J0CFQ6_9ACTN|nr:hypothetical protein Sfulv_60490 [Streptomyces fulvorobeus]